MTDAYGMAALLGNVMDTPDAKDDRLLPQMKKLTLLEKLVMYLSIPFHIIKIGINSLSHPNNINPFTTSSPYNCGVKRGAFAKEYSVAQIKEKSKQIGVTFNDVIMTVLSMTIRKYFIEKGDQKTKKILVTMPISYREQSHRKEDFEFQNNVSVIPIVLDLVEDFHTGVKIIH